MPAGARVKGILLKQDADATGLVTYWLRHGEAVPMSFVKKVCIAADAQHVQKDGEKASDRTRLQLARTMVNKRRCVAFCC